MALTKSQLAAADGLLNRYRVAGVQLQKLMQGGIAELQAEIAELKVSLDAIDPAILNPPNTPRDTGAATQPTKI